jgi:hypothetical protein
MNTQGKRSYIPRKKYLNDSIVQIKSTLEFIRLTRKDSGSAEQSHKAAVAHAQSIEAVCWSPHSRLSADGYQRIMAAKTQELCWTLLRTAITSLDLAQLQRLGPQLLEPVVAPPRVIPHPILPMAPVPRDDAWPHELGGLDMGTVLGDAGNPFEPVIQENESFL